MDRAPMPGEAPAPQKSGGFSLLKCCLVVGCLLVLLAGGAGVWVALQFRQMLDPVYVAQVANEIVPCEVPAGYRGYFALKRPAKMAWIMPENLTSPTNQAGVPLMIMLVATPEKVPQAQLEQQAKRQLASQGHQLEAESDDREEIVTVRGQPTKAKRAVAVGKRGERTVNYTILLEQPPTETNPSGQALIMFIGAEGTFDRKAMDGFLKSIK